MTLAVTELLRQTDIYLIDQILKQRYAKGAVVLDAGCGTGRNMHWFLQNDFDIYGVDANQESVAVLQSQNNVLPKDRFRTESLEQLSFTDQFFDHVICSAVLHFAKDEQHFMAMFKELLRVLKHSGSLFIRMTSDISIEEKVEPIRNGVYMTPDGSTRFLLTRNLLHLLLQSFPVSLLEEVKTVNVADMRCMTTLVLKKTE